jgi:hypothetical protein
MTSKKKLVGDYIHFEQHFLHAMGILRRISVGFDLGARQNKEVKEWLEKAPKFQIDDWQKNWNVSERQKRLSAMEDVFHSLLDLEFGTDDVGESNFKIKIFDHKLHDSPFHFRPVTKLDWEERNLDKISACAEGHHLNLKLAQDAFDYAWRHLMMRLRDMRKELDGKEDQGSAEDQGST